MALFTGPFHPAADTLYPKDKDPWLVPGLVPHDAVVILSSAPKTGKTCFATALARALATGGEFLGHRLTAAPVLWCAHEESPLERTRLHEGLTMDDPLLVAYPDQLPAIDEPEPYRNRFGTLIGDFDTYEPYVFRNAQEIGAKLIVVDCLHAAVRRGNLAENFHARKVVGRLRDWAHNFHVSVLVLHHLTKSTTRGQEAERFADTAQILAAASCHHLLQRTATEEGENHLTIFGKVRYPEPPTRLDIVNRGILDYRLAEETTSTIRRQTAVARVRTLLEDGWRLTAEEIARRLDLRPSTVRHLLADLAKTGQVVRQEGPYHSRRYSMVEDS